MIDRTPMICGTLYGLMLLGTLSSLAYISNEVLIIQGSQTVCYEFDRIDKYGDKHPYCNTDIYNGTKYLYVVAPGRECIHDDTCPPYDCIEKSFIRIGDEKETHFDKCYKHVDKDFFQKNCTGPNCGDSQVQTTYNNLLAAVVALSVVSCFLCVFPALWSYCLINRYRS